MTISKKDRRRTWIFTNPNSIREEIKKKDDKLLKAEMKKAVALFNKEEAALKKLVKEEAQASKLPKVILQSVDKEKLSLKSLVAPVKK